MSLNFQYNDVIAWLLDSDPAIRWQVLQDLIGAPTSDVANVRAWVAKEGWGAELLFMQGRDGSWGGAAWNRGWDSTMHVLTLLRILGLDPSSSEAVQALTKVRENVTWQGDPAFEGRPFFTGEVEPCINGQTAAAGAYFKQDVQEIIDRLLGEQLADGGWNCEAEYGSRRSSFNTTICVLDALLEYEMSYGAVPQITEARQRGQEYLLARNLMRRLSTGETIRQDRKSGADWAHFAFPTWWHYDVLRGLDYLRRAGVTPDDRIAEAIGLVESRRRFEGWWLLDTHYLGHMAVDFGERVGQPSRWVTLMALRVLKWYRARR